jgi:hypothetical protein
LVAAATVSCPSDSVPSSMICPTATSSPITTGHRSFAKGLQLCRESNIGRSAKDPLPRASARQILALGKVSFAESLTLRTNRTSAKPQLCTRSTYAVIFAESRLLGSRRNIFLC